MREKDYFRLKEIFDFIFKYVPKNFIHLEKNLG
jgi:hypothetical protein